MCTAALTCRTLRDAAREETLWSMLYRQRWGDQPRPSSAGESFHEAFKMRSLAHMTSEQREARNVRRRVANMTSEQREARNVRRRVA